MARTMIDDAIARQRLERQIATARKTGLPTGPLEAERSLRMALHIVEELPTYSEANRSSHKTLLTTLKSVLETPGRGPYAGVIAFAKEYADNTEGADAKQRAARVIKHLEDAKKAAEQNSRYSSLAPAVAAASAPSRRSTNGERRNPNAGIKSGGAGTPSVTIRRR